MTKRDNLCGQHPFQKQFELINIKYYVVLMWMYGLLQKKLKFTKDLSAFGFIICIYECCVCFRADYSNGDGWYTFRLYLPETKVGGDKRLQGFYNYDHDDGILWIVNRLGIAGAVGKQLCN